MCDAMGISYYVAPPEAHNTVLCERFHRYLNKVQRIGAADSQSYEKWAMSCLFAAYAWNGLPVDGTDIIRSSAAKARTFHFPLDVQSEDEVARIPQQGEATIQHVETMFPLWFWQKKRLKLLIDERRTKHRDMANKSKTKRTFQPGDLVLVRKQVTSKAVEGKPAKLTIKARGPYRVLEAAGENSYYIQLLPAVQSLTKRPGKRSKELAMRMERLPSSLVVHKRVNTLDTTLAEMGGDFVSNPLERNLGFYDFGRYTKAPDDADYAFEKLNDLWNEEIPNDDSDEESSDESEAEPDNTNEATENEDTNQRAELRTTRNTNSDGSHQNHQERKRLKRKQNDEHEIQTPDKRTKRMEADHTTSNWLKQTWQEMNESVDKLTIIKRQDKTNHQESWYLVQVDLDETNERRARKTGEYHVRYYVKHYADSKKRLVRNCKFWPLIRELKANGDFGDIVVIRPAKVEETLKKRVYTRGWYQSEMNICRRRTGRTVQLFNHQGRNSPSPRGRMERARKLRTSKKRKSGY